MADRAAHRWRDAGLESVVATSPACRGFSHGLAVRRTAAVPRKFPCKPEKMSWNTRFAKIGRCQVLVESREYATIWGSTMDMTHPVSYTLPRVPLPPFFREDLAAMTDRPKTSAATPRSATDHTKLRTGVAVRSTSAAEKRPARGRRRGEKPSHCLTTGQVARSGPWTIASYRGAGGIVAFTRR